jgi:ubiquinone/menaquinone biosynthesis C-methylase UbiE
MTIIKNQTSNWNEQSFRYALQSSKNNNIKENIFSIYFKKFFQSRKIKNILDVGCGNGDFLQNLIFKKKILKFGLETSQKTVNFCKKRHRYINFKKGYAHKIPFKQDEFDLTVIWSVLHWIDRNYYLQALGELLRVTKKYLAVMDFAPTLSHKTGYSHKANFYTYKSDFDKILSNSGYLQKKF